MGILSSLFGGSSQSNTSTSANTAFPWIVNQFDDLATGSDSAFNDWRSLLSGDTSGFDTFKKSSGFDALLRQGSKGITGNAAAAGLLNSGSTGKALVNYGNTQQNQYLNNYMDRLLQQINSGINAGNLITQAGQTSTSSGSSGSNSSGFGNLLGSIASSIALSDRRLKTDITPIKTLDDGLPVYQFRYKNDDTFHVGVMADEVAELRPEALGPVVDGYSTVNYDKIWSN